MKGVGRCTFDFSVQSIPHKSAEVSSSMSWVLQGYTAVVINHILWSWSNLQRYIRSLSFIVPTTSHKVSDRVDYLNSNLYLMCWFSSYLAAEENHICCRQTETFSLILHCCQPQVCAKFFNKKIYQIFTESPSLVHWNCHLLK